METIKITQTLLLITIFISTTLNAASFDCTKANNEIEKSICKSSRLNKLDNELSEAFKNLKNQLGGDGFQILIGEQRRWITQRNNACKQSVNIDGCLHKQYADRIHTLTVLSTNILPPLQDLHAICHNQVIRTPVDESLFDINNDGVNEIAEECLGGTMHAPCIEFKNTLGEEINLTTIGFEWATYWTFDSSYFSYQGKVYNAHATDKGPSHIRFTTPENLTYVVCEFDNIESKKFIPILNNTSEADHKPSTHSKICSLASVNRHNYIDLEGEPQLSRNQLREFGRRETGVKRQGYLDINNDGESEFIAELEYTSGAGRGCDFLYFDELGSDGMAFNHSQDVTPLLSMQGVNLGNRHPNCGGMNNRVFEYEGQIYYETNTPKEHRISQLANNEIRHICDVKKSITTKVRYIGPPHG